MAQPTSSAVLIVIAGPAGSGKSTLCDRLVLERPEFSRVVTTTTRPAREGEINGVHYHFFTPAEFRARLARGEFLEWAQVRRTAGNRLAGSAAGTRPIPGGGGNIHPAAVDRGARAATEEARTGQ